MRHIATAFRLSLCVLSACPPASTGLLAGTGEGRELYRETRIKGKIKWLSCKVVRFVFLVFLFVCMFSEFVSCHLVASRPLCSLRGCGVPSVRYLAIFTVQDEPSSACPPHCYPNICWCLLRILIKGIFMEEQKMS